MLLHVCFSIVFLHEMSGLPWNQVSVLHDRRNRIGWPNISSLKFVMLYPLCVFAMDLYMEQTHYVKIWHIVYLSFSEKEHAKYFSAIFMGRIIYAGKSAFISPRLVIQCVLSLKGVKGHINSLPCGLD